jgi:hypothetical protein
MTSRVYRIFMQHSSVVLYVMFLLSLFAVLSGALTGYLVGARFMQDNPEGDNLAVILSTVLGSFRQAFDYTAMMLFASAFLFRADKWLEKSE